MKHAIRLLLVLALTFLPGLGKDSRPNVVLIVCDDLNDFTQDLGGHPQAITPHMERLAQSGVSFHRAYSNHPICAPSRASFLTGIYGHTSQNFRFGNWYQNEVLANSKTMMEHFRDNGYYTLGSGKLMHQLRREVWDEFENQADYGPIVWDGKDRVAHPSVPMPYRGVAPIDGSFAPLEDIPYADDGNPESGWINGRTWDGIQPLNFSGEGKLDQTPDERNAEWAARRIRELANDGDDQPFFLGVGFLRPHTPLHVWQRYFDLYPRDSLGLAVIKPGDNADTHYKDVFDDSQKGPRLFRTLVASYTSTEAALKAFTQAYLACVTAVDDCIGQVVDAVDSTPLKDNTIIILTSDHGWTMGQKDYLFKNSLWEESTRVPYIIRAPGVSQPGTVAMHPVSLIDLYPTLVDLCNLKGDTRKNKNGAMLDGHSVVPFLKDPLNGEWDGPEGALSCIWANGLPDAVQNDPDHQHYALRTARWRYVRYNNGLEELYDHQNDPYEWTNLARDPEYQQVKEALREELLAMRNGK